MRKRRRRSRESANASSLSPWILSNAHRQALNALQKVQIIRVFFGLDAVWLQIGNAGSVATEVINFTK